MPRDRAADQLRPIEITLGFLEQNPSSVIYASGRTKVLCTATLLPGVPAFLEGKGSGWVTAEYDLLPGATLPRHARERSGRLSGRTQEIQRLIGRSLRGVLDLRALSGFTVYLDCDVLEADGGTRTASINGAYLSLSLLVRRALADRTLVRSPFREALGAISVGIVDGRCLLDLDYEEDSAADVDLNLVLTASNAFLEIQGTSEGQPFSAEQLDEMLELGRRGIAAVIDRARRTLES